MRKKNSSTFWPKTAYCWSEFLLKVVLIFAGIGAAIQYYEIKETNRVKETMEQLKNFNSDNLLNARLNLNSSWEPYHKSISFINEQTVESELVKEQILSDIIFPIIKQKNLRQDIDLLTDFFENLHICVKHEICHPGVSADLFCGDVTSFFDLHKPWIKLRRCSIPAYANQLEAFARECVQSKKNSKYTRKTLETANICRS